MTEARRTELEALVEQQAATIKRLEARVAELERQLGQSSSNSGKPPSSDGPAQRANRQKQVKRSHRKRGGQPERKAKMRALVPPEQVDRFVDCHPQECRWCGTKLPQVADPTPVRHQVLESPMLTPDVTEHRLHRVGCDCGFTTCETLPSGASPSLLGPRFAAFLTVLTGAYHLSRRRAVALVHDLTGVQLSLGAVSHSERRVSDALATPVAEAHEQAREAPVKHIDETGWLQTAARRSLRTIAMTFLTVLVIATDATRATVQQLLGAARGILASEKYVSLPATLPPDLSDATVVKTINEQRVRHDFSMSVTRIELDVEKKVVVDREGERHVVAASTAEYGPPRYSVTWQALATLAVLVAQFALPFNRLATMLSVAGKRFTSGALSRMLHYVAERLVPIYLELARQLADCEVLAGDDTSCRVLEVSGYFKSKAEQASEHKGKQTSEHKDEPPWAAYQTPRAAEESMASLRADAEVENTATRGKATAKRLAPRQRPRRWACS